MRLHRSLLLAATLLAVIVIGLGAYVRLNDAGLGCPDWPGCYGHYLGLPASADEHAAARQAFPHQAIDSGKAWKEMIHRYCAGLLGLLILALAVQAWGKAQRQRQSPLLPTLLLGIVGLQAALGMWTVTLRLKPLIVCLHLLGGMTTLALLVGLLWRSGTARPLTGGPRWLAHLALFVVIAQIALGGWVSSNYAALACPDLPWCSNDWQGRMDFAQAFTLQRELGQTAAGAPLSGEALAAIHWSHRLGALAVLLSVGSLALALYRSGEPGGRQLGLLLAGLLTLQIGLGLGNVLFSLPLALAVAHNLGAAALLTAVLVVNLRCAGVKMPVILRSTAELRAKPANPG